MAAKKSPHKQLSQLWMEYTVMVLSPVLGMEIPLCGLCGNSGLLDTTPTTKWNKTPCGIRAFCICPNGRAQRKFSRGRKYGESSDVTKP